MSYRSILLHLDIDEPNEARVQFALRLSRELDAFLIGLGACAFEPLVQPNGVLSIADITVQTEREIAAKLTAMGQEFLASAAAESVKADWRQSVDLPSRAIEQVARAADLIVSRPNSRPWDPFRNADVADVVLKAGRPVLVLPPLLASHTPKRAMIAWKDTREARRALADSIPLLISADDVLLASIDEGPHTLHEVDDVLVFLSRHGVSARAERFDRGPGDVGNRLLTLADERDIDLVIAGAYGHSRFREWAFGGVTRDLLRELPRTSCLLSN
jgi:nucleotide-binding universal stress UspA family protein